MSTPSRLELCELNIDTRLVALWREAGAVKAWDLERVGVYIRAAYGIGYCDALREPERGALCREHGYRVPGPQA